MCEQDPCLQYHVVLWASPHNQVSARREHVVLMLMRLSRHVETDSPTYSWMNGKFLILRGDDSVRTALSFTIYEETSSSTPGSS